MLLRILMILFFLGCLQAPARAVTPELVAGFDFTCLLASAPDASSRSAVRCWSLDGESLRVPLLQAPTHLAATEHTVCAVDVGKITCWDFAGGDGLAAKIAAGFSTLRNVTAIAGANHEFCAGDEQGGLKCFGVPYPYDRITMEPGLALAAPTLREVEHIVMRSRMACAITLDHQAHCWKAAGLVSSENTCPDFLLSRLPKLADVRALSLPNDGSWFTCRACALEGNTVECWGKYFGVEPAPNRPLDWRQTFVSPTQVLQLQFSTAATVIGDRRAVVNGLPYFCDRWTLDLPGGIVLGSVQGEVKNDIFGQTFCVANEEKIRCAFHPEHTTQQNHVIEIEHGLFFHDIVSVADTLEAFSRGVYPEKAFLYRQAVALLHSSSDELREPFVMLALRPLAQDSSDYEQKTVRPFFVFTMRAYKDYHSMGDLPVRPELQAIGLRLLATALRAVPSGRSIATDQALGEMKSKLGAALAEAGNRNVLDAMIRVFFHHRAELAAVSSEARLAWLSPLVENILSYLAS